MECRHGLAIRILSVRPSVKRVLCEKKRQKLVPTLLYHIKDHLSYSKKKWLAGEPILPKILGQTDPVSAKTLIFNRLNRNT